mgnify:CR=1 FL=1
MTRRFLTVALVLALAVSACGSSGGTDDADRTAGDTTPATSAPAPLDVLRIRHPETLAFAAPFTALSDGGPLHEVARKVEVDTWSTPDVLRSLLLAGRSEVTAVPTYVGANLANKGVDVRLVAVVVWGLLWVIGPDGEKASWESLRGQTVMVPFRDDMPDLVFRRLATANGLEPGRDFTIEYYATPPEVVGRLVNGTGRWAVLPEHVATLALTKARQNGHALGRVLDLQEEWASTTGAEAPRVPQAGVVMPGKLAGTRPDVVAAVLDALEESVGLVNAASPETVAELARASGLPAPLVKDLIPRLNLEVVPAAEARGELERFYKELAELNPAIIGGRLPGRSFYLDDPR